MSSEKNSNRLGLMLFIACALVTLYPHESDALDKSYGSRVFQDAPGESLRNAPHFQKIDHLVRKKLDQIRLTEVEQRKKAQTSTSAFSNALARTDDDGKVQVYIHTHTIGPDEKFLLRNYGAAVEIANEKLKTIQAWVPPRNVSEIAQLPFVKRISAPKYAITRTGSVITIGDSILRANELRAFGSDGSGVKVGVISDGMTNRAAATASGDLPAVITVLKEGNGDEGTALLEIIHDLAPGAELGFCGPATSLEMIQCVNDLADVFGADIIVDDLGFFAEPYFEDGPIAQAINGILANRIFVSAAGNEGADQHYSADFFGTNSLGFVSEEGPVDEHNFGLSSGGDPDPTLDVTLNRGSTLIFLQWNDPFGGSGNDYDLLVLDSSENVLFSSTEIQDGDDDPFEALEVTLDTTKRYKIVVTKFSGENKHIKLYMIKSGSFMEEYAVSAGSIFGHPAVPGVLAVVAIDSADPGNDSIEDFCSQGPVEIFFPSPETRPKPDVAAIDGVSVTGTGGFLVPFFGTSAAAPHVAGVAALLLSRSGSPDEVAQAIKDRAVDLGKKGFDYVFGFGRIDALSAFQELNQPPEGRIETPVGDVAVTRGQSVEFSGSCTDPDNTQDLSFLWRFGAGSGIADITAEDPGPLVFNAAGIFRVTFTCTDGGGKADPTPDTRTITVREPSHDTGEAGEKDSGGGGGGGGGCFINAVFS